MTGLVSQAAVQDVRSGDTYVGLGFLSSLTFFLNFPILCIIPFLIFFWPVGLAGCLVLRVNLEVFAVQISGSKGINSYSLLIVTTWLMFYVKMNLTRGAPLSQKTLDHSKKYYGLILPEIMYKTDVYKSILGGMTRGDHM